MARVDPSSPRPAARPAPSGRQATISAHGQELTAVEVGGGIRSYRLTGEAARDVLDPYPEGEMCSGGRGQILAPWPNRLGGAAFEWRGRRLQGAVTEVEHGNAIHGLVRWSSWTLPDRTPGPWGPQTPVDTLSLTHRLHPRPGWPWTVDLRATYRLSTTGLEVRTWARNESPEPCPFGLGWHPYLQAFGGLVDDLELQVPASTVYDTDAHGLPTGRRPVAGSPLDFRSARPIGDARLDTAFTDLERDSSGRATVTICAPGAGRTRLWMDRSYSHLMVFTGDTLTEEDRRRRGLAVEPMTCAPDMLRTGDGMVVLDPGETFEAAWGIEAELQEPFS